MDYRKQFRVKPGQKLKLNKLDPTYKAKPASEAEAKEETEAIQALARQQALLYAEHKHSVLIVLQAMDAGGKDGTIRHVFSGVNPQGITSRATISRRVNLRMTFCGAPTPKRREPARS